ncbi:MAG: flagellar export protein FliJ [Thermodesulfovibrionales bacterium]
MSTPVESLLNIRRWKEDEAKNRFALLLRDLAAAEEQLLSLEGRFEELRRRFDCCGELLSIEEVQSMSEHVDRLIATLENQKRVVAEKQHMVEAARSALAEATRERKIFERLDEKQKEAREREHRRKEQIRLDEHAATGHTRKKDVPSGGRKE